MTDYNIDEEQEKRAAYCLSCPVLDAKMDAR
jgi:hypothetical protein